MKLTTRVERLHLRHTFRISRGAEDTSEVVIAEIEHEGVTGLGEASPSEYYGETPRSVEESLRGISRWLSGEKPEHFRHVLDDARSRLGPARGALCALDLALMDWNGKKLGWPLHRFLGLDPARVPPTSFTIGIDSIPRMVEKLRETGDWPVIKVKLGTAEDLEIVRALREHSSARFRVDANCAWTAAEAIEKSRELASLGVELIEQPLPPDRLDDMERVRRESALPVFADENAVVPEDVPGLAGKFHGVNIKLVKCGGILPAIRMVHLARTLDLRVMFGCMIESSIACTAAAQLGPLADHMDIDGPLLITDDPYRGVEYSRGAVRLPGGPGLGVEKRVKGAAPRAPR